MSATTTETKTSTTSASAEPDMSQIKWSSAVTTAARSNAADLLKSGWSLSHTKDGLEREYVFGGFAKAMEFMNQVALQCRTTRHHPEWANVSVIDTIPQEEHSAGLGAERWRGIGKGWVRDEGWDEIGGEHGYGEGVVDGYQEW
jgi:pterin-4a-carbinolamine dehydratase